MLDNVAKKIADVICGGELDANTKVDSQYLLDLEKKHFIELLKQDKTQDNWPIKMKCVQYLTLAQLQASRNQ